MGGDEGLLDQSEIEQLFGSMGGDAQPDQGAAGAPAPPSDAAPAPNIGQLDVQPFQTPELGSAEQAGGLDDDLSLIADVDLNVRVELGRTRMYIEDVLKLRDGSIVPLEKLAGDPVDVYVNGQLLARGEVLVLNDNFCVRISEIIGRDKPEAGS
ncbi:Flagellar motor switch protein FliN [Planctomycetes bacterium Pan216]|uniref:Flagellar motor switch protein FliN n=1 Tax=Kolteria novifilia TaxID=2527975 RepID=A0A518B971_9BACT|nr:Flagellar motor switch protein FliN [Planctomycetes bacterium Pan216]